MTDGRDLTRYHVIVDGEERPDENKRNAVRVMITALADRGIPLAAIREKQPDRAFRVLLRTVTAPAEVSQALAQSAPGVAVRNTKPTLAALSAAFPEAKVSFRTAAGTE